MCEYCENKRPLGNDGANDAIIIERSDKQAFLVSDSWEVEISYCPACGRKIGAAAKEQHGKRYGWIYIHGKEDLPEEKINPVTRDFYEYPCIFQLDETVDIRYYKFGRGHWWDNLQIIDDEVIAWMDISLPETSIPREGGQ